MSIKRLFVLTDPAENNNKFWEVSCSNGDDLLVRWGRVGTKGGQKVFKGEGLAGLNKRLSDKLADGYQEVSLVEGSGSAEVKTKAAVAKAAVAEIAQGNRELAELMERLAEANRHDIVQATGGAITFNAEGMAQTAVGIVTQDSIAQARLVLTRMAEVVVTGDVTSATYVEALTQYLRLIPQKVGARRGWHRSFFGDPENLTSLSEGMTRQFDLLDDLEESVSRAQKALEEALKKDDDQPTKPLFETQLERVLDKKELKRIEKFFAETTNRRHESAKLRIARVFRLCVPKMREGFAEDGQKVGGVRELWHGTRASNVLSILKSGLVVPPATGSFVNGRMFGNGLYFSDQSTKSLNYSYGLWDRTNSHRDSSCFMFLANVALGRPYTPARVVQTLPNGFDSMFAKAGVSGVLNNEMIVYRVGQADLTYLIEFSA